MPSEFILDTVALRVMTFAHQDGLSILLKSLSVPRLFFPTEVYNRDEHLLPLQATDEGLSELARGLRYAERQILHSVDAQRYQQWLNNAVQISHHLNNGMIVIEGLNLDEARRRDDLMDGYGIGPGEAACLALMERDRATGIFVSSDRIACRVANELGLSHITLEDVLARWIETLRPSRHEFDVMIQGMWIARYVVRDDVLRQLRSSL